MQTNGREIEQVKNKCSIYCVTSCWPMRVTILHRVCGVKVEHQKWNTTGLCWWPRFHLRGRSTTREARGFIQLLCRTPLWPPF